MVHGGHVDVVFCVRMDRCVSVFLRFKVDHC